MSAVAAPVREGPILMSGPMVRATLDGRKTKTRRVVKPQPPEDCGRGHVGMYHPTIVRRGEEEPGPETFGAWWCDGEFAVRCPYGNVGDRLWVRESWAPVSAAEEGATGRGALYRCDPMFDSMNPADFAWNWKPSIHMPRWASRLTLEITEVRVERLHDCTEEDARAEGLAFDGRYWEGGPHPIKGTPKVFATARQAYASFWDSLNAKRGFGSHTNPWIWVIGFRRALSERVEG